MELNSLPKRRNFGPWTRRMKEYTSRGLLKTLVYNYDESFDDHIYDNMDLSVHTKRAALKISPSVVSLVIAGDKAERKHDELSNEYRGMHDKIQKESKEWEDGGGETCLRCSGTIIRCDGVDGKYVSTILTSCSLIRSFVDSDVVLKDIKIDVYLSTRQLLKGEVDVYDMYHNIATVKILSDNPLPVATLCYIDDSISIDPNNPNFEADGRSSMQLRPHSSTFKFYPGEMVVAVGRNSKHYDLMAAAGIFSLGVCSLDSNEVFRADCVISKCGIGGPLVNRDGKVIGVNFIDTEYTPFMPINIASKCLNQLNKYGRSFRPWLGAVITNLYTAKLEILEAIIQNLPGVHKGVIVEKVIPDSPADRAGVLLNDVIIQCNENPVLSYLEFLGMIWDKIGESVELLVIRTKDGTATTIKIVVEVTSSEKINRWPVPEICELPIEAYRLST